MRGMRQRYITNATSATNCPHLWILLSNMQRWSLQVDVISVNPSMKILVWISIPCTGGTPWIYINLMNESSRRKVEYHQFVFQKIWSAMSEFVNSIRHLQPFIALEWPSGCVYWKYDRVIRFLNRYNLEAVKFDGCRLGVVNKDGTLMKKPWTIASNCGEINKYIF